MFFRFRSRYLTSTLPPVSLDDMLHYREPENRCPRLSRERSLISTRKTARRFVGSCSPQSHAADPYEILILSLARSGGDNQHGPGAVYFDGRSRSDSPCLFQTVLVAEDLKAILPVAVQESDASFLRPGAASPAVIVPRTLRLKYRKLIFCRPMRSVRSQ